MPGVAGAGVSRMGVEGRISNGSWQHTVKVSEGGKIIEGNCKTDHACVRKPREMCGSVCFSTARIVSCVSCCVFKRVGQSAICMDDVSEWLAAVEEKQQNIAARTTWHSVKQTQRSKSSEDIVHGGSSWSLLPHSPTTATREMKKNGYCSMSSELGYDVQWTKQCVQVSVKWKLLSNMWLIKPLFVQAILCLF